MTKQERQQKKEYELIDLITKTEAINNVAIKAEPFINAYYDVLKDLWTKKIGWNEAERVRKQLITEELKRLNKEYTKLLK
jgi:hypothetical protein